MYSGSMIVCTADELSDFLLLLQTTCFRATCAILGCMSHYGTSLNGGELLEDCKKGCLMKLERVSSMMCDMTCLR